MKRIMLLMATNLAIVLVLGIVSTLTGANRFFTSGGLDFGRLLFFALIMGFGGAFISLWLSKTIAKWSTGARVVESPANSTEFWLLETVGRSAQKAGLPMPEVAIYEGEPKGGCMNGVRKLVFLALAAVLPHAQVNAQVPEVLREAVRKAVVTNPEVQARWHGFRAAEAEQDVAKGGSYPQVDLTAGVRHEWRKRPGTEADDYTRRGASLSLNQMVYDGFFTRNEVARMGYARLARYYELLDASESASLEVVRAYGEVLRYRKLVRLAQQNYVEHKQVFEQIPERASAGVGRRVDLDQATGLFRGSPRPTAVSRKLLLREKV